MNNDPPHDTPVAGPSIDLSDIGLAEIVDATPERDCSWSDSAEPLEIINPIDGECTSVGDVDGLVDMYVRVDALMGRLSSTKLRIREALAALSEGDAKTRRVRGQRRRVKLTFPSATFDQSKLKEAYHAFPQFRDEVLAIERLKVRLREYKKLVNEASSAADFTTFRDMLTGAERPAGGIPSVTIEE